MHEPLNMMEDTKKDQFFIKGLVEHSVTSIKEIFERLKKGEMNRHYAQTYMNHSSSRSHTIFRVTVKGVTNSHIRNFRKENIGQANVNIQEMLAAADDENHGTVVTESYLNFVDLAGSERIGSHMNWIDEEAVDETAKEKSKNVQDNRIKEGKSINKSLFFLTQVISLKAEGKSNQYIPFRNSPLTKILRSSLGGNFRTLVVLCVNPCQSQVEISLSTMRFGQNAKKIQNSIKANIVTNNNDESIKILIENYEKKMRDLQAERDEDLMRFQQYFVMIDELRLQRSILLERLEQANKKLSIHIADEISENDLFNFFRQAQTKVAFVKEAGLLYVPQKQTKYDNLHQAQGEQGSAAQLKRTFDDEMRTTAKEFVNKFALQAYNNVKAKFEDVKANVEKQQTYIKTLCESFKTIVNFISHLSNLGSVYLEKLNLMSEQYQDEFQLAHERLLKLDLYEKYRGFSLLSDSDLQKLKVYIRQFRDHLKGELDRREMVSNGKDLPQAVIEELQLVTLIEQEEQDERVKTYKQNLESFVSFREGCAAEIDYYKEIYNDFKKKNEIEEKSKQIDDFMNNELQDVMDKVRALDSNLRENDIKLESFEKKNLDKKLAEYQSKFEKLVGVVLAQNKSSKKPKEEPNLELQAATPTSSGVSPSMRTALGKLKRSQTANADDLNNSGDHPKEQTKNPEKKIKAWLTLKQIEEEPLSYDCMMRDDESEIARSVHAVNLMKSFAANSSKMLQLNNEDAESVGSFQNKITSASKDIRMSQFGFQKSKTIISDNKFNIGNQIETSKWEDGRRSFIVGRTAEPVASDSTAGRFSVRNFERVKNRFGELSESKKNDDKLSSTKTISRINNSPRILDPQPGQQAKRVHIKEDNDSSCCSSQSDSPNQDQGYRKSHKNSPSNDHMLTFKGTKSNRSNGSPGKQAGKALLLLKNGAGIPLLNIQTNKLEQSKDAERSERVHANQEVDRASYKSFREDDDKDRMEAISMDHMDLNFETSHQDVHKAAETLTPLKRPTPDSHQKQLDITPSKASKDLKKILPRISITPEVAKKTDTSTGQPKKNTRDSVLNSSLNNKPSNLSFKKSVSQTAIAKHISTAGEEKKILPQTIYGSPSPAAALGNYSKKVDPSDLFKVTSPGKHKLPVKPTANISLEKTENNTRTGVSISRADTKKNSFVDRKPSIGQELLRNSSKTSVALASSKQPDSKPESTKGDSKPPKTEETKRVVLPSNLVSPERLKPSAGKSKTTSQGQLTTVSTSELHGTKDPSKRPSKLDSKSSLFDPHSARGVPGFRSSEQSTIFGGKPSSTAHHKPLFDMKKL